jgi:hypothetical protein
MVAGRKGLVTERERLDQALGFDPRCRRRYSRCAWARAQADEQYNTPVVRY